MLPLSIEIVNGGVYYFVLSNGNVKRRAAYALRDSTQHKGDG